MLVLQRFLETLDMRAAELDDFLTGYTDEMVMLLIAGGFEVAMVLLEVRRFDEALLAQEIERAVDRGETDAVTALPGDLKDLIRAQVPGLLADNLQDRLTLPCKAAAG